MSQHSPIKGRRISNQVILTGKLKKKTFSEAEFGPTGRDLESSYLFENLKSHMQQCQSDVKVKKAKKKKLSLEKNAPNRKSQQLIPKKKKKTNKIKKSVSAERVKSSTDCKSHQEISYLSPEFVKRKKAATFFNNDKPMISLQDHRKQLGLDFLNHCTTKRIDQILERNRMSSVEKSIVVQHTPEKRRSIFTPNQLQDLKHYIREKKKFHQQIETLKLKSQQEKRIQINENLKSVAENAKRSSLSNSRSPPRDSTFKVSSKPLMLSYVAQKSKRPKIKQQQQPQSLKVQYQQLANRYKSLKIKNQSASSITDRQEIRTNSSKFSGRESREYRDYEYDMRCQFATIIQKHWRRYQAQLQLKYKKHQIKMIKEEFEEKQLKNFIKKEEVEKLKEEETKKWEQMKSFIQQLQGKKEYLQVDDILQSLIQYADFNKENVFQIEKQKELQIEIKPKLFIESNNCFPPQIGQILFLRAELIKEREQKEKQILKELLIQERISPRSFGQREQEISKWGQTEQEQLQHSRHAIKEGWLKAYETIQKTQKDLRFIQKLGNDNFSHIMPLSLSQSNLLKNQLHDLKFNVLYFLNRIVIEKFIFRREFSRAKTLLIDRELTNQHCIIQFKQFQQEFKQLHIGDAPLDLEEQNSIREPAQYQQFVQTHIAYIRNYLEEIKAIVQDGHMKQFKEFINIPIGPSAFEILRFFRMTEEMLDQSMDGGFIHQAVISLEVFTSRERLQSGSNEFFIELDRIHNKSIFDAFNEALDYYRPYGIKGRPLPWRKQVHQREILNIEQTLDLGAQKVITWAESLCGILLPNLPNQQIDGEIIPQIREERLDKMLKADIFETDDRWQEYDEEWTEVCLELSEVIFDDMIAEFLIDFNKINRRK
ncbi:hypothetical protein pb186bvf_015989 [Paramecium bursaria]